MGFTVQLDQAQVDSVNKLFGSFEGIPEKVISRSINDTVSGSKTDASTEIRKILNASKSGIDALLVTTKATVTRLTGVLTIKGEVVPLMAFNPSQTQKGVTVKEYKAQGRKLYVSAFIATMKTGHADVFRREYKGTPVGRSVTAPLAPDG